MVPYKFGFKESGKLAGTHQKDGYSLRAGQVPTACLERANSDQQKLEGRRAGAGLGTHIWPLYRKYCNSVWLLVEWAGGSEHKALTCGSSIAERRDMEDGCGNQVRQCWSEPLRTTVDFLDIGVSLNTSVHSSKPQSTSATPRAQFLTASRALVQVRRASCLYAM